MPTQRKGTARQRDPGETSKGPRHHPLYHLPGSESKAAPTFLPWQEVGEKPLGDWGGGTGGSRGQRPFLSRGPRLTVPGKANILKQSEVWGFNFYPALSNNWASLVAHMVKNLPIVQKTWVQSLGQEDSLEKEMATRSSILAWRIP